MRAREILAEVCAEKLSANDPRLVKVLFDAVDALLECGQLTLTALGRSLPRDTSDKHSIKCVDRLIGNRRFESLRPQVGAALADALFHGASAPVILVDWTEAGPGFWTLSAATPIGGRAIALYHDTHPTSQLSNPKVERCFLETLKDSIVPEGCKPIIVTDAGFKVPWFRCVLDMNWDFVGRLGGSMQSCREGGDVADPTAWRTISWFSQYASHRPLALGTWLLTKQHNFVSELVIYKGHRKNRKANRKASRKPNRKGVHAGSKAVITARKRAKDPWFLATSLMQLPSDVVAAYRLRMQIEETFRDTKSHRYGWSFEDTGSRTTRRLNNLLLIAILGCYVTVIIGVAAEAEKMQVRLQANTLRRRRVYSLFFLGRLVLSKPDLFHKLKGNLNLAVLALKDIVGSIWPSTPVLFLPPVPALC